MRPFAFVPLLLAALCLSTLGCPPPRPDKPGTGHGGTDAGR